MAKNKKNKHSKRKAALQINSAQAAQSHMDNGRFRQAVDSYKALCKNGQDQFRLHLKAAYEGLYRQRLAKDQFEQAAMVLDQLEKQFPGATRMAAVTLHLQKKEFSRAATAAADLLQQQPSGPESDNSTADLADALVLAFEPEPVIEKLAAETRRDLCCIWAALECITNRRYDQSREEIRPIGMRSVFSDWKWFIKGMAFFYEQQDHNALRAFENISSDSVPGRAAIAYLKLLQNSPWCEDDTKNTDLMEKAALIAGYGPQAAALARGEYLWQVNRLRDSLSHLQHNLEGFPTYDRGLMRTLTELYYNTLFELSPENAFKYFEHLRRSVRQNRRAGETIWDQRAIALFSETTDVYDLDILNLWESFLDSYSQINNGDSRLARSHVFKRLGDIFAEEEKQDDFFPLSFFSSRSKRPKLRNPDLAEHCYEESINANPKALAPQLAMAAFLEKVGDDSALNGLLDRLIQQYPDEKNVLAKAGIRCDQRNAYVKAMKYLERALALDPMDYRLREALIVTAIKAAVNYYRKGNTAKARALLPRVLEMADRQSDDFNRGPAYLYARWAAMERLLDNEEQAQSLWQQAVTAHLGTEFKLHLFYRIIAANYGLGASAPKQHMSAIAKALKASFNSQIAFDGVQVLQYAYLLPKVPQTQSKLIADIEDYLEKGANRAMIKEQAGAIVRYLISPDGDRPDIAQKYIKQWLRSHPEDALFRYWRYLVKPRKRSWPMGSDVDPEELHTILRLAREQRENEVAAAVQKILKDLEEMHKIDDIFERAFYDEDDDEPCFWDEDDDFDDDDPDDEDFFYDDGDSLSDLIQSVVSSLPTPKRSKKK